MTSQKYTLQADIRTILGRKVKTLRAQGILPVSVYGEGESLSLQLPVKTFASIYRDAGETGLIYLSVEGRKQAIPVMIVEVATTPVKDEILHASLRKVDLSETIEAMIPIELIGESPAVNDGGVVVSVHQELAVEALPQDFPESFEVDLSKLQAIGDTFTIADLSYDSTKVKILLEPDQLLVTINEPDAEPEPEAESEDASDATTAETPADDAGEDAPKSDSSEEKSQE